MKHPQPTDIKSALTPTFLPSSSSSCSVPPFPPQSPSFPDCFPGFVIPAFAVGAATSPCRKHRAGNC